MSEMSLCLHKTEIGPLGEPLMEVRQCGQEVTGAVMFRVLTLSFVLC